MRFSGETEFHRSVLRVRWLFSVVLWAMGALWLVVVPALELERSYQRIRTEAGIRLALAADLVSSHIANNLETWEFEGVRLPSLVTSVTRGSQISISHLELLNGQNRSIMDIEAGPVPTVPLVLREPVTDGVVPVGEVVMTVALDPAFTAAARSGGIGLVSVLVLLTLARVVGRRMLDHAMAVVGDTTLRLAQQLEQRDRDQRLLARQALHLRQAGEDFAHVARMAAHHLQEPLRTVLAYAQLLLRWHREGGGGIERADGYVEFVRAGIEQMRGQLSALAAYMDLRTKDFSPQPVELEAVVAKAAAAMAAVDVRLNWQDLPVVAAQPDRLYDLFFDIFGWSKRYRLPDQPLEVSISAEPSPEGWVIAIADNGRSLGDRDPERMFGLLVHDGDGRMVLGLAAARLTVFMMGGRLWAEPTDTGARLSLEIPNADACTNP